jgi:hypothetical protein
MATDPALDLVNDLDKEIQTVSDEIESLSAALDTRQASLDRLVLERATVAQIAQRRGVTVPTIPVAALPPAEDWSALSRVDAVERVLRDSSSPMHLTEIQTELKRHGRSNDGLDAISATLAHIKGNRGTVVSVGHGRWEYVRAGTTAAGFGNAFENVTTTIANGVLASGLGDDLARIMAGGDHPERYGEALQRALADHEGDASDQ